MKAIIEIFGIQVKGDLEIKTFTMPVNQKTATKIYNQFRKLTKNIRTDNSFFVKYGTHPSIEIYHQAEFSTVGISVEFCDDPLQDGYIEIKDMIEHEIYETEHVKIILHESEKNEVVEENSQRESCR